MLRVGGKHFSIFSLILVFFFLPQIVKATDPPLLTSPINSSETSDKSPKLIWEYSGDCIDSGSCFRIEIDNSSDFSSPEKSTYTKSLSYSPQGLTEGSWYWRVKAKDKSEKWSDWSTIFKLNITNHASSDKTSPISQATSAKTETSFNIKDSPSEIKSDQEFEISVSLKVSDKPNANFYLKGAFRKSDSSNYFGETFASSNWVKNGSSYSKQLKISTDGNGNWEGKIKVRPDSEDSGFQGTGDYILKVGKYTDSGSGPTWSNELNLKINNEIKPSPSPSSEIKEQENDEENNLESSRLNYMRTKDASPQYELKIASVAGEASMSNNISLERQVEVLNDRKINWLLIILGMGILVFSGGFIYFKFKQANANN